MWVVRELPNTGEIYEQKHRLLLSIKTLQPANGEAKEYGLLYILHPVLASVSA